MIFVLFVLGVLVARYLERGLDWLWKRFAIPFFKFIWRILAPPGGWIWQITRMVKP